MHRYSPLALALAITLVGCGDDPDGPGDTCPATLTDVSGLTGSTHRGTIDTDTTWAAADSPHVIEAVINVRNATLTIEPCAVVLLDPDVAMRANAGGNIQATGTADAPIVFAANQSERWDFLLVDEAGVLNLAYATFSGGGADLLTYDGATLVADGPTSRPYVQNLEVHNVTITDSAGYGVLMARHAAFATGSAGLTISGAGTDDASHPSPLRIDAQALSSVPEGNYAGNAIDQIEVEPFVALEEDTTVFDRGVPYWVANNNPWRVARAFGNDTGPVPQLTIEAGVTIAFEPGSLASLQVGVTDTQPGSLTVGGTSAAPVTLTSAAASPAAGDWEGVVFTPGAGAAGAMQSVAYATIEYAGNDPSISGYACFSEDSLGNTLDEAGAVVIYGWAPTASFLTNSTLRHSLGWGVFRGWDTTDGPAVDFTPTNTFLDLVACEQNDVKDICPGASAGPVIYACAGNI